LANARQGRLKGGKGIQVYGIDPFEKSCSFGGLHAAVNDANDPRFDVPESNYETVMLFAEVPPHVNSGLHTHPGFDVAYLLEGELTVITLGKPDQVIKPGESWHVPPGVVHEVKAGNETAKVIAAYIVEKGKPMATPYIPISN
jgi:quercetin dioxygenase-like cupin family protein